PGRTRRIKPSMLLEVGSIIETVFDVSSAAHARSRLEVCMSGRPQVAYCANAEGTKEKNANAQTSFIFMFLLVFTLSAYLRLSPAAELDFASSHHAASARVASAEFPIAGR